MHINEEAGINFLEVKGGLSTNALANAITKTHADKQVQHAEVQSYAWLPQKNVFSLPFANHRYIKLYISHVMS